MRPDACHVILRIVDPRFLISMESHDVASITCQTLEAGMGGEVKSIPNIVWHSGRV